jgi:hypothetical protein
MSKLIDALKKASGAEFKPMGFGKTSAAAGKPRILLIACLSELDVEALAEYAVGADAGLLSVSEPEAGAKALKAAAKAVPKIPWGGWLRHIGSGVTEQVTGADFLVLPARDASIELFKDSKVGKILGIDPSLSDGLLKAIDDLPVDGVFISGERKKDFYFTWHHLMQCRRASRLLDKPLLVLVPPYVAAHELQALWEVGVSGVVVDLSVGEHMGRLAELRKIVDKLDFSKTARRQKVEPLLPRVSSEGESPEEEEEEE